MNLATIFLTLFVGDLAITIFNTRTYRDLFPNEDFTQTEANPLVSRCWKKWGLKKGTIIALIIMTPLIYWICKSMQVNENIFWVCVGAYLVVYTIHINFYLLLKKLRKQEVKSRC